MEVTMIRLRMMAVVLAAAAVLAVPMLTAQGGPPPGQGPGGGGPPGQGGGEDEGYGNNLSVPVVFAEGYGLLGLPTSGDHGLRPRDSEPGYPALTHWDTSTIVLKDGASYYPQQSESHWQARWDDGSGSGEAAIVDWSDNLTKQQWTARSVIRVETVLYQNDSSWNLLTYPMTYLFGSGPSEMQGTTGIQTWTSYRTVYSICARLKIEKLLGPGGPVDTSVPAELNAAVYERFGDDGPGGYGAEVNVSGKVIYGTNWMLAQSSLPTDTKAGWWRLTFSLDPTANYTLTPEGGGPTSYSVARKASLASLDPGDDSDEVMFRPTLPDAYTSVLEIEVIEKRTGRKPDNPGRGGGNPGRGGGGDN